MSEFRELIAWQRGMALARATYSLTASFPRFEMFGLTNQLRRAAISIPSNIAEGHGRWHRKEYLQFLSVSHGSLNELETLLDLAESLGYESSAALVTVRSLAGETGRLLAGLKKSLRPKPPAPSTQDLRPKT